VAIPGSSDLEEIEDGGSVPHAEVLPAPELPQAVTPSGPDGAPVAPALPGPGPTDQESPGLSRAWRALRHRNFRLFFSGQSISLIGTWMTRIATSWLVYRLTGSALLLGVVGFVGQIPTFLLAPFAGVWVDRLNRRNVLVWTQVLAAVQSLVLAGLTLAHIVTIREVLLLSVFQGLINAFDMPGRQAFLIEMVEDRKDLGNAIAINSSMVNAARLIGPTIAGVLIAVKGEGICFLIDGISYLAVIASLLLMRLTPAAVLLGAGKRPSMMVQLREGWDFVVAFVPIRSILLLFAICSLMGMPYTVLMPIFASKILHGGPHTLGFLMGAAGSGALVAALSLAFRKSVVGLTKVVPTASALFGLGLILFGLSRVLWVSMLMMVLVGYGMMEGMAASNTIIQTLVREDMRGRVMSYYTMAFVGMAPFGSLLAGGLAHMLGAPLAIILTGSCCIAGAAWFTTQLPAIRKVMRPIYQEMGLLRPQQ
jgi:MFS family permease